MKIANLKEIKTVPVRVVATTSAHYSKKPLFVHICDQRGKGQSTVSSTMLQYNITRCNRAVRYPYAIGTLDDFRLCSRCGTRDDFEQALAEYTKWQRELNAARDTRWKTELEIREEKAQRLTSFIHGRINGFVDANFVRPGTCVLRTNDAVYRITCEELL